MNLQLKDNVIKVSGRIDSSNASDFEEQLWKLVSEITSESNTEVKLDFDELIYISSAGLRVLLKLIQKKYTVTVENVSDDVYDILDVTGFSQMLTVVKKSNEISIDDCEVIGIGSTGRVYKVNDELIIKLFDKGIPREAAEKEQLSARTAFINGVPTAIPFEVVEINGQYGLKYELMNGMTLGKAFSTMPEKFDELLEKYVALVKKLKNIEIVKGSLEQTKDVLKNRFARVEKYLSDEDVKMFYELLDLIPEGKAFVHGDCHPGNIMVQNGELLLVDMADATMGPSYYEITQIYSALYAFIKEGRGKGMTEQALNMKEEVTSKVWDAFIEKYLETSDQEEINQFMGKLGLLRAVVTMPKIGIMPDEILSKFIPKISDYLINGTIRPNLDTIKALLAKGV